MYIYHIKYKKWNGKRYVCFCMWHLNAECLGTLSHLVLGHCSRNTARVSAAGELSKSIKANKKRERWVSSSSTENTARRRICIECAYTSYMPGIIMYRTWIRKRPRERKGKKRRREAPVGSALLLPRRGAMPPLLLPDALPAALGSTLGNDVDVLASFVIAINAPLTHYDVLFAQRVDNLY